MKCVADDWQNGLFLRRFRMVLDFSGKIVGSLTEEVLLCANP